LEIEAREPPLISEKPMLGVIRNFYKNQDKELASKQIANKIDQYIRNKYDMRTYQHSLGQLEVLFQKKDVTHENLTKILKLLDVIST
jgi:hypothetical protein